MDNWREQASCSTYDSEMFFPDMAAYRDGGVDRAKAVCRRCPVEAECLQAAMAAGEKNGIWGGRTPEERAKLRRRMLRRPEPSKPCSRCRKPRPLRLFPRREDAPDGHATVCTPCNTLAAVGESRRREAAS